MFIFISVGKPTKTSGGRMAEMKSLSWLNRAEFPCIRNFHLRWDFLFARLEESFRSTVSFDFSGRNRSTPLPRCLPCTVSHSTIESSTCEIIRFTVFFFCFCFCSSMAKRYFVRKRDECARQRYCSIIKRSPDTSEHLSYEMRVKSVIQRSLIRAAIATPSNWTASMDEIWRVRRVCD